MNTKPLQHTPGPWIYSEPHGYVVDSSNDLIAAIDFGNSGHVRLAQANGYLIAAAPDLLAACREMTEWDDSEMDEDGVKDRETDVRLRIEHVQHYAIAMSRLRAAIEKAESQP